MTNIDIATLPKNIQTAIHQFEQIKSQYLEQQERLSQLSQRMEKHRKAAEATMTQAEQFGSQWREIFRKNDGELTKEIRTLKTSEQESRDFSEEYNGLVNTLMPEFELCQLDTHDVRLKHLESAKDISTSYTNHVFTAALNELLSSAQMKLFLISLKIKFDSIEKEVSQDQRIYVGAENNETLLRQAKFLRESFIESINAISDEEIQTAGFGKFTSIKTLPEELVEVSTLAKLRRRDELASKLN